MALVRAPHTDPLWLPANGDANGANAEHAGADDRHRGARGRDGRWAASFGGGPLRGGRTPLAFALDRETTPCGRPWVAWVLVCGHYPIFSAGGHHDSARLIRDLN